MAVQADSDIILRFQSHARMQKERKSVSVSTDFLEGIPEQRFTNSVEMDIK